MELLPPKLCVLPPSDQLGAIVDGNKLWAIDSPSLEWSLGLAYLFSNVDKGNFENVLLKLFGFEEMPKMNHWILQAKNSITKYNPFKNRNEIYSDRNMRVMFENIKTRLHAVIDLNEQQVLEEEQLQEILEGEQIQEVLQEEQLQEVLNKKYVRLLEAATKLFDCVIILYGVDLAGECEFKSMYNNSNISMNDSLKIVIFQRPTITPSNESNSSARFGFGLSLGYSKPLRHSAVVHFLKTVKLPDDKILQIEQARFSDSGLLKCLFEAGCEDSIPSIYRSPYLVLLISEAGFDTDPCTLDDSGFSSFYYSIGLPKCDSLNILYHFVTNNSHLTDSSARNPDSNILLALEKVENVIKNDCLSSNNFQLLNLRKDVVVKRYQEILFFNKYQRDICQHVYDLKKEILSMDRKKQVMVSILDTYHKYLYFDSILSDDHLELFENVVRYSEFHENLDNFNCLLFFENVSAVIPLMNTHNSSIFYDAISSLFLSVLSNDFFPKHKHVIDCTDCELSLDDCEQNQNSRRFIPFHYRTCFSEKAKLFAKNLKLASEQQKKPAALLLDILRQSLLNLSEIVDEFIITRLTSYLEVATRMQLHDSPIKRMLTMERALQVVGEVFGNETVCSSMVRTLLQSCISAELVNKLCCMRDNTLSHYRKNAINGRLKIEKDKQIVNHIQEELSDIDGNFLPVYISQIFRVKEFLTKEVKTISQNKFESIECEMDTQLIEFINKRKPLFGTQELNFEYLLSNFLKKLYGNLNIGNNTLSEDIRRDLEALHFLLNFITDHCSNNSSSELTTSANKLKEIVASFKDSNNVPDEIIDKIKKLMKYHLKILETVFKCVQKESYMNADFPYILSLNDKIKNNKIFNAKEKRKIQSKVLEYVNNSAYLMQILKNSLGECVIIDDLNSILECMILPEPKRSGLAQEIAKNTKIGFKKAQKLLSQVNEREKVDELCLFDENVDVLEPFTKREELMNMLLKIKFPRTIRKKVIRVLNTKLWFLIDRIDQLKTILILEDDNLSGLWRSKKWNATIEKQMKFLMVQRYMREKDLQASLEMLLFDCMNILEKREDLEDLWYKTNDLFNGANMIKVLAHGNPILQTVGTILSPEDLPSEFIEKILELIKDVDSMRALSEMWKKTKLCKSSKFLSVVDSEDTAEYMVLRKRIKSSSRWEEYSKLLPLVR